MTKKKTPTKPVVPAETKPVETLEAKILEIMQKLAVNGVEETTSTVLRDKLNLDKESGRDKIRRAMKRLEKAGKVIVEKKLVKEKGAQKRFVYRLKESK